MDRDWRAPVNSCDRHIEHVCGAGCSATLVVCNGSEYGRVLGQSVAAGKRADAARWDGQRATTYVPGILWGSDIWGVQLLYESCEDET